MSGLKRIVDLRGGILEGFKYVSVIQRALVVSNFRSYFLVSVAFKVLGSLFWPKLCL